MTKCQDVIDRAGGGPLQAFCRSSTTFTSALLLSSKFYPCIRAALRDKVLAPPRLNVAELSLYSINLCLRPMTMETPCSKVILLNYSKRNRLKDTLVPPVWEHGKKMFVFLGLFVHAAVRGGTCAFALKIVNTLIKNSSRDDTPSIST